MDTSKDNFPKVLSLREKVGYGLGDFGYNVVFEMGQLYLLKYLTDTIKIAPAIAGGVFVVAKVWDAFADITVGTWVDNRRHIGARGKFRPFILWAAIPMVLLLIANFSIPNFTMTGKIVWAYVSYMIFGTVYSISNIPYGSMQPTMTKNSEERSQLASWRNIGSNSGLLLDNVAFMPIVMMLPTQQAGYTVGVIIFAIIGVIAQWLCYFNIKENYTSKALSDKQSIREIFHGFKAVFHNGPLLILCLVNFCTFSAYNVKLAVQFYFAQYVLHNIKIVSYMSFFTIGCSIIAAGVMPQLTKLFGKKKVYILGGLIWVIADTIGFFWVHTGLSFAILMSIAFFGNGIMTALNWALISDVIEYGEWKTNIRAEGITYSSYTWFRKIATAAAGFIPGYVLSIVGYVPNQAQTAQALMGIRGGTYLYPIAMSIIAILLMLAYPITEAKYAEIIDDLRKRHVQNGDSTVADPLTRPR